MDNLGGVNLSDNSLPGCFYACSVTPIVGPRFECLNCRATAAGRINVCLRCEPRLHEEGGHAENHVFAIKMPPRVVDAAAHVEGLGGAGRAARDAPEGDNCLIM